MNTIKHSKSFLLLGLASIVLAACPSSNTKTGVQPFDNPNASEPGEATAGVSAPVSFPVEEFRNTQPAAAAPRDFNLPGIVQFKLAGQLDVFLVEGHDLPTISMELNFDGGSIVDKRGREGTASICMSMATEGTQKLDKLAFEESLADLASSITSYAGTESQGLSMQTLSKNYDATFALFSDSITAPAFRKSELDRMVEQSLASLKQAKGSPSSAAGRLVGSVLYGSKHPMGRFSTEKSIANIKTKDCTAHYRSYIKPKGARLFVVGDITKEKLIASFTPLLKKWKGKAKRVAKIPRVKNRTKQVVFVNLPGAAQSTIFVAHAGPDRKDKNYFTNQMMSGVLGGGFSSRINMNLREDKGYSYGARGSFNYNRHFGTFVASSSVRSNATRQSLEEIFKEMVDLKSGTKAATQVELDREKNGAILGLPARFATSGQVLQMYRNLVYYGLPMDNYNSFVKNYSAVTLEQVNKMSKQWLSPEAAIVFVVGDGSAKQIVRGEDKKDMPRMQADGKTQMTLLDSLKELASSETGGKSKFLVMDVDGTPLKNK